MIYILQEVSLIGKVIHFWDTCAVRLASVRRFGLLLRKLSNMTNVARFDWLGMNAHACLASLWSPPSMHTEKCSRVWFIRQKKSRVRVSFGKNPAFWVDLWTWLKLRVRNQVRVWVPRLDSNPISANRGNNAERHVLRTFRSLQNFYL